MADVQKYINPVSGSDAAAGDIGTPWKTMEGVVYPSVGDRLVLDLQAAGDITDATQPVDGHILLRGIKINTNGFAVTWGANVSDTRIFDTIGSTADTDGTTIDLGLVELVGTNATGAIGRVHPNISGVDWTVNGNVTDCPEYGLFMAGSALIDNLVMQGDWAVKVGITFKGVLASNVSSTTPTISGSADFKGINVTGVATATTSGYAALQATASQAGLSATLANAKVTVNAGNPTGSWSGIRLRDFATNNLTDTISKITYSDGADSVNGVWVHNPNFSGTITMDRIQSELVNPVPVTGSPKAILIGDGLNGTNLITDIQADGYISPGVLAKIKGAMTQDLGPVGLKGIDGIYVDGVNAAAIGDADIHRFDFEGCNSEVTFNLCDNVRSYVWKSEKGSKLLGAFANRLFGCTDTCGHFQYTVIAEEGFEHGNTSVQSSGGTVGRGESANALFFVKSGADYASGSRSINKQGDTSIAFSDSPTNLNPVADNLNDIGLWRNNNYFLSGGLLNIADCDVYAVDASATHPVWGLNRGIGFDAGDAPASDWTTDYLYSGSLTADAFNVGETNIDPVILDEANGPYIPTNQALASSGVAWMQPGDIILDANNVQISNTSPGIGFLALEFSPVLEAGYADLINLNTDVVSVDLKPNITGATSYTVTFDAVIPSGLSETDAVVSGTVTTPTGTAICTVVGSNSFGSVTDIFQWTTLTAGSGTTTINRPINSTIN